MSSRKDPSTASERQWPRFSEHERRQLLREYERTAKLGAVQIEPPTPSNPPKPTKPPQADKT